MTSSEKITLWGIVIFASAFLTFIFLLGLMIVIRLLSLFIVNNLFDTLVISASLIGGAIALTLNQAIMAVTKPPTKPITSKKTKHRLVLKKIYPI